MFDAPLASPRYPPLAGRLTDEQVRAYLSRCEVEADSAKAEDALRSLLEHRLLTDAQFELARLRGAVVDPDFTARTALLRRLEREGPTAALIEDALETRSAEVQEALLEHERIQRAGVERLAAHGATKRVKNAAAARLKRTFRCG